MSQQNGQSRNLVAFIHGGCCSLGEAVATDLAGKGVRIVLHRETGQPRAGAWQAELKGAGAEIVELPQLETGASEDESEAELMARAHAVWGQLDILVNICVPNAETRATYLQAYPALLLERGLSAAGMMAGSPRGAIVNHCFLPSMYAGTEIEPQMPVLRGAITGVTRHLCRKLGPEGIRINTIQTGLLDLPETRGSASEQVLKLTPPVGRWGCARDFARFVTFLALRNGYMTGQSVILDGGMTAGNTGT